MVNLFTSNVASCSCTIFAYCKHLRVTPQSHASSAQVCGQEVCRRPLVFGH